MPTGLNTDFLADKCPPFASKRPRPAPGRSAFALWPPYVPIFVSSIRSLKRALGLIWRSQGAWGCLGAGRELGTCWGGVRGRVVQQALSSSHRHPGQLPHPSPPPHPCAAKIRGGRKVRWITEGWGHSQPVYPHPSRNCGGVVRHTSCAAGGGFTQERKMPVASGKAPTFSAHRPVSYQAPTFSASLRCARAVPGLAAGSPSQGEQDTGAGVARTIGICSSLGRRGHGAGVARACPVSPGAMPFPYNTEHSQVSAPYRPLVGIVGMTLGINLRQKCKCRLPAGPVRGAHAACLVYWEPLHLVSCFNEQPVHSMYRCASLFLEERNLRRDKSTTSWDVLESDVFASPSGPAGPARPALPGRPRPGGGGGARRGERVCQVCSLAGHNKTAKAALQAPLPTTVEPIVCMAVCHQTELNGQRSTPQLYSKNWTSLDSLNSAAFNPT
eukprot:gene22246-biopygen8732